MYLPFDKSVVKYESPKGEILRGMISRNIFPWGHMQSPKVTSNPGEGMKTVIFRKKSLIDERPRGVIRKDIFLWGIY